MRHFMAKSPKVVSNATLLRRSRTVLSRSIRGRRGRPKRHALEGRCEERERRGNAHVRARLRTHGAEPDPPHPPVALRGHPGCGASPPPHHLHGLQREKGKSRTFAGLLLTPGVDILTVCWVARLGLHVLRVSLDLNLRLLLASSKLSTTSRSFLCPGVRATTNTWYEI